MKNEISREQTSEYKTSKDIFNKVFDEFIEELAKDKKDPEHAVIYEEKRNDAFFWYQKGIAQEFKKNWDEKYPESRFKGVF